MDPEGTLDPLVEAGHQLLADDLTVEIAGRTIRLSEPVSGDPSAAALRILGRAQAAAPVGAAAHSATGVAAAVWAPPHLYLARWASNRWIVGYRIAGRSKPSDYIRSDGRIPSHLETGNWYLAVPDGVRDAFLEVGLSLESPPFPLPARPEPEPARGSRRRPPTRAAREPKRDASPGPASKPPDVGRLCPGCNMRRAPTQFGADSDLCVDCR